MKEWVIRIPWWGMMFISVCSMFLVASAAPHEALIEGAASKIQVTHRGNNSTSLAPTKSTHDRLSEAPRPKNHSGNKDVETDSNNQGSKSTAPLSTLNDPPSRSTLPTSLLNDSTTTTSAKTSNGKTSVVAQVGNLEYPENTSAIYFVGGGGDISVAATWKPNVELSVSIGCGRNVKTATGSGEITLEATALTYPTTCEITLFEPTQTQATVSYSIDIT